MLLPFIGLKDVYYKDGGLIYHFYCGCIVGRNLTFPPCSGHQGVPGLDYLRKNS